MSRIATDYDAIVVGSGPNGLAAAITIQRAGFSVLLIEGKDHIGGGMESAELTLPGFVHDVCSAIYPLAADSPFFNSIPLKQHGLEFIYSPVAAAHPFDDGTAVGLYHSIDRTADSLLGDKMVYKKIVTPLVEAWPELRKEILAPFHFPKNLNSMLRFAVKGLTSAKYLSKNFQTKQARGLWAGMAAHSTQAFSKSITSAIGLVMIITGHVKGWPLPKGGASSITKSLNSYFLSLGGVIETNFFVRSLKQLPSSKTVLFDVTPRQLLQIAGEDFSRFYRWQLKRFRYGPGVFKIDWALDGPIPFTAGKCSQAGTIHLGNSFEEIAESEQLVYEGKHPEVPFVLLAQQSLFDPSRAPGKKQTAWAYCHVPNGSEVDMTEAIEKQVERFAPGFRDLIIGRHSFNTKELEGHNENYVGGDISGGLMTAAQLFTRPALRFSPYRTSAKGIYICSSSTPPGGGVHGMCGYYAAKRALKDIFDYKLA
jgi:phytoene dehydrogenase-like protein